MNFADSIDIITAGGSYVDSRNATQYDWSNVTALARVPANHGYEMIALALAGGSYTLTDREIFHVPYLPFPLQAWHRITWHGKQFTVSASTPMYVQGRLEYLALRVA